MLAVMATQHLERRTSEYGDTPFLCSITDILLDCLHRWLHHQLHLHLCLHARLHPTRLVVAPRERPIRLREPKHYDARVRIPQEIQYDLASNLRRSQRSGVYLVSRRGLRLRRLSGFGLKEAAKEYQEELDG